MRSLRTVALTVFACVLLVLAYVYIGIFDVAADQPHGVFMTWMVKTLRERSIAVRSIGIKVPELDAPALVERGAREYAQMCAGCHLGPGVSDNEFRRGLNPIAPALAAPEFARERNEASAVRRFWIVKHGIKMSAMPAWGITHDDDTLWSIVAFLQQLPELTPERYAQLTGDAAADERPRHEHVEEEQ